MRKMNREYTSGPLVVTSLLSSWMTKSYRVGTGRIEKGPISLAVSLPAVYMCGAPSGGISQYCGHYRPIICLQTLGLGARVTV